MADKIRLVTYLVTADGTSRWGEYPAGGPYPHKLYAAAAALNHFDLVLLMSDRWAIEDAKGWLASLDRAQPGVARLSDEIRDAVDAGHVAVVDLTTTAAPVFPISRAEIERGVALINLGVN